MKNDFFTISTVTKMLSIDSQELKKIMKLLPVRISPDKKFLNKKAINIIDIAFNLSKIKKYSYEEAIEEIFKSNDKQLNSNKSQLKESTLFEEESSQNIKIEEIKNSLQQIIDVLKND
jgi:hypothetical protein